MSGFLCWPLGVVVGVLVLTPRLAMAQSPAEEYWFVVEMQGQRCGHMHVQTAHEGGRFKDSSEMRMEIKRGEVNMPVSILTEFVETDDGKPVRMKAETKLGALPTVDEYTFKPDGVDVAHTLMGSRRTEKKPLPDGEWLTPMGMEKAIAAKIAGGLKPGDEFSVRSVDPAAGLKPTTTTMKLVEKTTVDVVGKTVPALKWTSRNDLVPNATSTEFTDEKGQPLRTEMSLGGIKMVMLRADKALALSKADPPELLESTFIKPDKQVPNARDCKRAVFVARAEGVPIGDWPSAGAQTATKLDEHTVRLREDAAGASAPAKGELEADEFRKPSSLINSDDSEVLKIEKQALAGREQQSKPEQAEALRKFVFGYITKKNFDVGFASAAETARTRCGDCTEHAVLLCALLRADGIPARCVSGLVYADGIAKDGSGAMGYHLWTQAILQQDGSPRWVDLDAALSESRSMDATHLAIQSLGLADGQTVNAFMDILPTLGKLKITVESAE